MEVLLAEDIQALADLCDDAFKAHGLIRLARVLEDEGAVDLLFLAHNNGRILVRCVARPRECDVPALQTMMREGSFDRAILIHKDLIEETAPIEVWPHTQLTSLAKSMSPT